MSPLKTLKFYNCIRVAWFSCNVVVKYFISDSVLGEGLTAYRTTAKMGRARTEDERNLVAIREA